LPSTTSNKPTAQLNQLPTTSTNVTLIPQPWTNKIDWEETFTKNPKLILFEKSPVRIANYLIPNFIDLPTNTAFGDFNQLNDSFENFENQQKVFFNPNFMLPPNYMNYYPYPYISVGQIPIDVMSSPVTFIPSHANYFPHGYQ